MARRRPGGSAERAVVNGARELKNGGGSSVAANGSCGGGDVRASLLSASRRGAACAGALLPARSVLSFCGHGARLSLDVVVVVVVGHRSEEGEVERIDDAQREPRWEGTTLAVTVAPPPLAAPPAHPTPLLSDARLTFPPPPTCPVLPDPPPSFAARKPPPPSRVGPKASRPGVCC